MVEPGITNLQKLLEDLKFSTQPELPNELSYLLSAFTPAQPSDTKTRAYVALSAFCHGLRSSSQQHLTNQRQEKPDPSTTKLVKVFQGPIYARLKLEGTNEESLQEGFSFFTALFQVDVECAATIFQQDGLYEIIVDSVDLPLSSGVIQCITSLLGQACGYKRCRTLLKPSILQWLEIQHRSQNPTIRASSAIALIKYSKGIGFDQRELAATDSSNIRADREAEKRLAIVMKEIILNSSDASAIPNAVEGLAYLSTDPSIKGYLASEEIFLKQLLSIAPLSRPRGVKHINTSIQDSSLLFGLTSIIANLCAHQPHMSEEEAQLDKLKRMAQRGQKVSTDDLETDEVVDKRIGHAVEAGVLDALISAITAESTIGIRTNVAKALLDIIQIREHRGKVLQAGGAKALLIIITALLPPTSPGKKGSTIEPTLLVATQALAKLAITSSPIQVFGATYGVMHNAIRPFSILLLHDSASLLQRFEALMALTNLASQTGELANHIAQVPGLLDHVELLMLEDHALVRRASTEMICNLVGGSEQVFELYSSSQSKLHILVALSDVDDLSTRLAASGALATLTGSEAATGQLLNMQLENHNIFPIFMDLINPKTILVCTPGEKAKYTGLAHRGLVCARNLITTVDRPETKRLLVEKAKECGLFENLVWIAKGGSAGLPPNASTLAVESIKHMLS